MSEGNWGPTFVPLAHTYHIGGIAAHTPAFTELVSLHVTLITTLRRVELVSMATICKVKKKKKSRGLVGVAELLVT